MRSLKRFLRGEAESGERGSALLLALLILGSLSMLGTSILLNAVGERHSSGYYRDSLQALSAAETGLAFAKRAVQDMTVTMGDLNSNGKPDFTMADTLSWGGSYDAVAEASDIAGYGIAAYRANGFAILAEGRFNGAVRRVKAEIVHDSFLKYARFVAAAGTSYGCGAVLTGEVYVGGDLGVASCGGTDIIQFLEFVAAVGDIPNANAGIFHRGYVTDAQAIDLENSADFALNRERARGIATDCSCEGKGEVGLYFNIGGGVDPLGIGGGSLNFSNFDFCELTLNPPDTVITYAGAPVINTVTGATLRANEFNGIIFFESDAPVEGTLDGKSARNVTVFATDDILITDNIRTGHLGWDSATGLPTGGGDPVNAGLVAYDYIYIDRYTPRVLQIDAALMATRNNWRVNGGGTADHPIAGPGPLDLDIDGITGETPVNHDPSAGSGWDELNINANTWVLNINGPIITKNGGSAYPWNASSVLSAASGPTRRYNYDLDVTDFPPPCYPVPLNLWKDVSWTELFETENSLASYLP
jgi:PilX N-terminal